MIKNENNSDNLSKNIYTFGIVNPLVRKKEYYYDFNFF